MKRIYRIINSFIDFLAQLVVGAPRNSVFSMALIGVIFAFSIGFSILFYAVYNSVRLDSSILKFEEVNALSEDFVTIANVDQDVVFTYCAEANETGVSVLRPASPYCSGKENFRDAVTIAFRTISENGRLALGLYSEGPYPYDGPLDGNATLPLISMGDASYTFGAVRDLESSVSMEVIDQFFSEQLKMLEESPAGANFKDLFHEEAEADRTYREMVEELNISRKRKIVKQAKFLNGTVQFYTIVQFVALFLFLLAKYWLDVYRERSIQSDIRGYVSKLASGEDSRTLHDLKNLDEIRRRLESHNVLAKKRRQIENLEDQVSYHESSTIRLMLRSINHLQDNHSKQETLEYIASDSELIERWKDSSYELPYYFIWSIPTLGFIGTVIGISGAMQYSEGVASEIDLTRNIYRGLVSSEIGVAFNTTLLALILILVGQFALSFVRRADIEALMSATETSIEICNKALSNKHSKP